MGQQQLLLLVLGIVIVGLAVVSGLQAFSVNQKKANTDALVLTGTRIASDLQAWMRTPTVLGGGRPVTGAIPSIKDVSVSLEDLGYPVNGSGQYESIDGDFSLTSSSNGIIVLGLSSSLGQDGDNNVVTIEVTGVSLDDITTKISTVPNSNLAIQH